MGFDFSPSLRRKLSRLRRSEHEADIPAPPAGVTGAGRVVVRSVAPATAPMPVDASHWVEAPSIYAPPPWENERTDHGSARVRRLRVPLPPRMRSCAVHAGVGYLDTETLGLGSQPIFLVGLAWVEGDEAIVEHLYAPDYAQEAGLLELARRRWDSMERVVTFNGKSYDLPLLRDRMARHRIRPPRETPNVDLLYAARRRWKGELPNCRLQTIEQAVLGRARQGDVPGHEIPERYHRAVRTGDDRLLAPVFVHNAIDLLTLIEIHPLLESTVSPVSP